MFCFDRLECSVLPTRNHRSSKPSQDPVTPGNMLGPIIKLNSHDAHAIGARYRSQAAALRPTRMYIRPANDMQTQYQEGCFVLLCWYGRVC